MGLHVLRRTAELWLIRIQKCEKSDFNKWTCLEIPEITCVREEACKEV